MATNPSPVASQNPFDDASSSVTLSTIQHVNIRTHVSITLDYDDSTFLLMDYLFDAMFHKFNLLNHVEGSVDAQNMWHNVDWLQIDHSIVSWLYTFVTPNPM
jgi:hypothetical protein